MMIRIVLFLSLFTLNIFACATCALMVPTVEVDIDAQIKEKHLKNINFIWKFSDVYTQELTTQYDKNKNGMLDAQELQTVLEIKNNYLQNKNMLTKISFAKKDSDAQDITPKYKNFKIYVQNNKLVYSFDAQLDLYLEHMSSLSFAFSDDEGYFSFVTTNFFAPKNEIDYTQNLYLFTASVMFSHDTIADTPKADTKPDTQQEQSASQEQNSSQIKEYEFSQENILKRSIERIKELFEAINSDGSPLAYISLLFFAYMYGIIHALGPGHGKTLVASYFLSNEKSYTKALFVSIAIGVVHTFSAFLLTLAIYYVLDVLFASFVDNAVFYTTKISAFIIIGIALYLLYKKHKAYKELRKPQFNFSATPHPNTCGCASCKVDKDSTDAALIISAGIIPCPGTITIFIFSLSLGLYTAGFLSALTMSFGMSTIIFFSAVFSVYFRKKTSASDVGFKKALEYGSLFIILGLGLILLFG
jgi:ABC-type nickel/cobalt efflux system permease component RcnA/ABC-type uncharacterized transport system substrate-binding protein